METQTYTFFVGRKGRMEKSLGIQHSHGTSEI